MAEKIIIFDFGSQYTQLIARRVRELNVYSEIVPFNAKPVIDDTVKGIILSGSPFSVNQPEALQFDWQKYVNTKPILAICYGAQWVAKHNGGRVETSNKREYGKSTLSNTTDSPLFEGLESGSQVWMSHGDSILGLSDQFEITASTPSIPIAAYQSKKGAFEHPIFGLQFHPEVTHSLDGLQIIKNFIVGTCSCSGSWTPDAFVEQTVSQLKKQLGDDQVLMALSGGVDSTVGAMLLHKAIGSKLHCFFIDNGLLRKNEYEEVLASYEGMGLNITGVDAKQLFYDRLNGISDPEGKRKVIGKSFIDVFDEHAKKYDNMKWLGQGTIYPDVIESVSVHGPSVTIKSHHNVGGLPEKMGLKVIEPLRMLFKDEVRRVGASMNIDPKILQRHPFPGPGLAIRILGDITPERVRILQEADHIYIQNLKESGWYDNIWQAGTILLPIKSVGVMGDERTYEQCVALRAVSSTDGMTAEWSNIPYEILGKISNEIINNVKGINRVVYDISTKPPATIEWE